MFQRIYKSDPLANLLAALNALALPSPVRHLLEVVAQHHYGQTLSLTLVAYNHDTGTPLVEVPTMRRAS